MGLSTFAQWMNAGGRGGVRVMRPYLQSPRLEIRQNALLRHEEWLEIDNEIQDIVRTGLVGYDDLINAGLTRNLGGLGSIVTMYEQQSDLTDADVSMEGIVQGSDDRLEFTPVYTPVPIIHKDFSISYRMLLASRRNGDGLDVETARTAARKVRDKSENMIFKGSTKNMGGYKIYGYTTAPYRVTGSATGDFGTAGNGYNTILAMVTSLQALGFNGPYGVYVANTQYMELLKKNTNDSTELSLILELLPMVEFVKPSFDLDAGSLVMVQLTKDVVQLNIAQDMVPVQWDEKGGFLTRFRVMQSSVLVVKYDAGLKCGVVHLTGA